MPIGVPAPGVRLAVLDRYRQPVPIGAVSELYISHAGVTNGYLGSSDAGPSTDDPFVEMGGRRWYRSGDLVRLVGDPVTLVYLGRADEQVKIGGIRLDPSEVEQALAAHPAISVAAVRWSPAEAVHATAVSYCVRCGLSSRVPSTTFDANGVCNVCHSHDRVKVAAASYFGTRDDLVAIRDRARAERTGRYDAIHLLSGGKDSTYALYQLVELGFEVLALTLDNGFISEEAMANARRSAADLGIDHEFMTTPAMNEIFRDSLERFSNVCNGCYKAIYTLATNRAVAEGVPVIVTGLSRGQLFETRLIPQQFSGDRFDPEAIDRAVVEARRAYHRSDDVPNRLLDTSVFAESAFDDGDLFDRIRYVDFYRYVDVELAEMLDFLDHSAPWVRPSDTGRSTNCLINAAGIHSHLIEQGYHNYAEPYAWDVRLGHKTRDEALAELDDRDDLDVVRSMLAEIDYQPKPREVLTAWVEVAEGHSMPEPAALRHHLADLLPAHAIPAAYVAVEQLPTTTNGKLDTAALPAPERVHRPGPALHVEATSDLERLVVERWERVLRIEPISATDDFFDLG
ncbi:MAG: AMP-binding protein, partial [Acidimicrobiales bacterium]